MKKLFLCSILFLLLMSGMAHATLMTIGTATYNGSEYNLIWDDDNNGNSVVWLDYTYHSLVGNWATQCAWANGLDSVLTYNIDAEYSVTWDDATWRLPSTLDGAYSLGYDGTTTIGFNITTSEMGHLFYEELGNLGWYDTSGNLQSGYGLTETGDFENLKAATYWTGTEMASYTSMPMIYTFSMGSGGIMGEHKTTLDNYGLAVRSGQVSVSAVQEPSTVPEPATFLLFGLGILGVAGMSRKKTA